MKDVRIPKAKLITMISSNRDQHRAQYEKAFAGYARDMQRALEENLAAFKRDARHRVFITEIPPEDHTRDYDVILQMLELSADDIIVLDHQSFRQYVRDEWGWKQQWTVSNSKYLGDVVGNVAT